MEEKNKGQGVHPGMTPWDALRQLFGAPLPELSGLDALLGTDFREEEKGYTVQATLPGYPKENVEIWLDEGTLHIKAWKDQQFQSGGKENATAVQQGSYHRTFRVEHVDPEKIEAKLQNGILTVYCPKLEGPPPRQNKIVIGD